MTEVGAATSAHHPKAAIPGGSSNRRQPPRIPKNPTIPLERTTNTGIVGERVETRRRAIPMVKTGEQQDDDAFAP